MWPRAKSDCRYSISTNDPACSKVPVRDPCVLRKVYDMSAPLRGSKPKKQALRFFDRLGLNVNGTVEASQLRAEHPTFLLVDLEENIRRRDVAVAVQRQQNRSFGGRGCTSGPESDTKRMAVLVVFRTVVSQVLILPRCTEDAPRQQG